MSEKRMPSAGQGPTRPKIQLCCPRSRLLDGFAKPDLDSIVGAATESQFPANSTITSQDARADQLFLLVKGAARYCFVTEGGRKVLLLWLRPGDVFGSRAMLAEPSTYLVGTEVIKDSSALVWSREVIRGLGARYPLLMDNALSIASDYLGWFLAAHLALITRNARERLAEVLIGLADCIGHKTPNGVELEITNEELSNTAHVTLFTTSRVMSEWQRQGVLSKRRGRLVLRSPERLLTAAHDESLVTEDQPA